jgi:hypothetical protein
MEAGERGPELVMLPAGATVHSNNESGTIVSLMESWMRGQSSKETKIIRVQIGRKVIADITAEEIMKQSALA